MKSVRLLLSRSERRELIGLKGKQFAILRNDTGTNIFIDLGCERVITVSGSNGQLEESIEAIAEAIENDRGPLNQKKGKNDFEKCTPPA